MNYPLYIALTGLGVWLLQSWVSNVSPPPVLDPTYGVLVSGQVGQSWHHNGSGSWVLQ